MAVLFWIQIVQLQLECSEMESLRTVWAQCEGRKPTKSRIVLILRAEWMLSECKVCTENAASSLFENHKTQLNTHTHKFFGNRINTMHSKVSFLSLVSNFFLLSLLVDFRVFAQRFVVLAIFLWICAFLFFPTELFFFNWIRKSYSFLLLTNYFEWNGMYWTIQMMKRCSRIDMEDKHLWSEQFVVFVRKRDEKKMLANAKMPWISRE